MLHTSFHNHHRTETHRALELLSDLYAKLSKSQEKQFVIEVERLIRVLKSRFFQALIDIQEYYEITLLDGITTNNLSTITNHISRNTWEVSKEVCFDSTYSNIYETKFNNNIIDSWNSYEIIILRGETGLGFSISGGTDNPHLPNDFSIYITKIIPGGAAATDGILRIDDIIDQVNDISVSNVTHAAAVDALKQGGDKVKMCIRRKRRDTSINEIKLSKGSDGFGFSIAGGIGNQHIPGDNGIYITKIMDGGSAQVDGRLKVGHKLVGIKNSYEYLDFENVTHEEAVEVLKNVTDALILYTSCPEKCVYQLNNSFKYTYVEDTKEMNISYAKKNRNQEVAANADYPLNSLIEENSATDKILDSCNRNIRTITLRKGPFGLGFNIVGGEDNQGIFISYILDGGPASINGELRVGDQIKSVDGTDFFKMSHEEAASILKNTGEQVILTIQYNGQDYNKFISKLNCLKENPAEQSFNIGTLIKTTEKKTMHVRALFDYDPNKDDDLPSLGLPFHFGDILHVTNASDDEWWLARNILSENTENYGIIPARKRWERKQRARDRSVKFEGQMPVHLDKQSILDKRKKNYSFSRKFPFMKNKDENLNENTEPEPFMLCYTQDDSKISDPGSKEILYRVELPFMDELTLVYLEKEFDDEENLHLSGEENILSYEEVNEVCINFMRPIVILGVMKDKLNDDLISEFPEKFGSCVPHTTRPKRDKETDGRDYHFITSREEMERDIQKHLFIEAGLYNGNLYGTSIASVKEVAEKGKHCILDVSGNAIKRLYVAGLYPIALFVRVKSYESIMSLSNNMTEDEAKNAFYRALRVEQEFLEYFSGIIEGETYQDIYEQIKGNIAKQSSNRIWIPSKFQDL